MNPGFLVPINVGSPVSEAWARRGQYFQTFRSSAKLPSRLYVSDTRPEIAKIERIQMNWFTNQMMGKQKPLYLQKLGL